MCINRQISILNCLVLFILVGILNFSKLSAEAEALNLNFENYKGVWLTNVKNEAIYMIIKENNLMSYFYKNRIDNNVYTGNWEIDEDQTLLVSGVDFNNIRFRLKNHLTNANYYENIENISTLEEVQEESLGELALPAKRKNQNNKNILSSYFGIWEIVDQRKNKLIKVYKNRAVVCLEKKDLPEKHEEILRGEWSKHGKQLHIVWEDGSYSILDNRDAKKVKLFEFNSGEAIVENKNNYKLLKFGKSKTPKSNGEEDFIINSPGKSTLLAKLNFKSLINFYRGEWTVQDETNPKAIEIIKFKRFGGVVLESDKKAGGFWYVSNEECLINLENGIRMRLKGVGSGFIMFVYKVGSPLDGYPDKVLKAAPLDSKKRKMLSGEIFYVLQLIEQAHKLNPTESGSIPLISNWSNKSFINPLPNSPWWWPIWSENTEINKEDNYTENIAPTQLTNDKESIGSNRHTKAKSSPNPMNSLQETNWEWPF